ncbi:unnamed protein product [Vitrella brassicaformis CCMP3155]|uniref:Kynureninase n=2 Tax=Vitrella brassicaformis TaxID=1169539 RepID=A0A0G4GNJ5_VITBC|nr:unnamed protein product [Vitrella brassicaformis CCMP3155]|eukprot:CEM31671.1 unnamed protein product [Vitrella brassicaformis CCMP3155]
MDAIDPIRDGRTQFFVPSMKDLGVRDTDSGDADGECVYLCGNSLGLQPRAARALVNEELDKWSKKGVNGHFEGERPWVSIDDNVTPLVAEIVGALPHEVAVMNSLTVNLQLIMTTFYEPTQERHKVLMEAQAFGSDWHAVASHVELNGYDPHESIMSPEMDKDGLHTTAAWLSLLDREGESISVVLIGAVQYLTGQFFDDIPTITQKAHEKGVRVLLDCAHAVGNVPLCLHDWQVDAAIWCHYKYCNAGPGAIGGYFIHEKHTNSDTVAAASFVNGHQRNKGDSKIFQPRRLAGWWGADLSTRFSMRHEFISATGAAGFRLSNPPVLETVALLASLRIHTQYGMQALRGKSLLLTGYLEHLLETMLQSHVHILTPREPNRRGCQLSLAFPSLPPSTPFERLFKTLADKGVVVDHREPNVIRVAPTPLYNSFADVWRFVDILAQALGVQCEQ